MAHAMGLELDKKSYEAKAEVNTGKQNIFIEKGINSKWKAKQKHALGWYGRDCRKVVKTVIPYCSHLHTSWVQCFCQDWFVDLCMLVVLLCDFLIFAVEQWRTRWDREDSKSRNVVTKWNISITEVTLLIVCLTTEEQNGTGTQGRRQICC